MASIGIDKLKAGMVLADDLKTDDGRLILPSGCELTESHLKLLGKIGLEAVDVQQAGLTGDMDEALLAECERYVRSLYCYANPDNQAMNEIFGISLKKTVQEVAAGWKLPDENQRRALNIQDQRDLFFKDEGTIEDLVKNETQVASFPDIYFKIREVLDSKKASATDIAKVVGTDVGLSTTLLKLVNSPVYALSGNIDSVSRAVALVGVKEISTLAMGISSINYFKDIPKELVDMKSFWKHSISCAIFSKILADKLRQPSGEKFFTAGLLHDVGRLILFKGMPQASVQALLFARGDSVPITDAEKEIMGFDHTEVGRALLAEWKFPQNLIEMIAHHHDPMSAENALDAAVIHIADNLANAMEVSKGNMYVLPGLVDEAWELLNLELSDLGDAVREHDRQIEEIFSAFFS